MKTIASAMMLAALAATPGLAQTPAPAVPLDQALDGAVSVAALAQGFLVVVREEGSLVCALNIGPEYFVALMAGDTERAEAARPGSFCVPASAFANLGSAP